MIKTTALLIAAAALSGLVGCAGASGDAPAADEQDLTKDACSAPALSAAESEYGNDPVRTSVKALTKNVKYYVVVGIGNAEDGAHDYWVTFPKGCASTPSVEEVPQVAPPLQAAAHTAYDKILSANGDKMDASHVVPESAIPAEAKKAYDQHVKDGKKVCSAVTAYKVEVSGEDTFAVGCDVVGDSIIFDLAVYDSKGGDIDQCSTYGLKSGVGTDGISWQNEVFEVPSN